MKVVMLGSVTNTYPHVSSRTKRVYETDTVYLIQGYILEVSLLSGRTDLYQPAMILNLGRGGLDNADILPTLSSEMFVRYSDYFSPVPTQAEIDNFAMIHGFIPCLIEI